ncbi:hypothetical protein BJ912DRAFT_120614 [Pholiota molesta]|nr:hypothetical protein BJ912DRAFT_120614 [Pholiota molesta]
MLSAISDSNSPPPLVRSENKHHTHNPPTVDQASLVAGGRLHRELPSFSLNQAYLGHAMRSSIQSQRHSRHPNPSAPRHSIPGTHSIERVQCVQWRRDDDAMAHPTLDDLPAMTISPPTPRPVHLQPCTHPPRRRSPPPALHARPHPRPRRPSSPPTHHGSIAHEFHSCSDPRPGHPRRRVQSTVFGRMGVYLAEGTRYRPVQRAPTTHPFRRRSCHPIPRPRVLRFAGT